MKPHLQATVKTLLGKGISQREINRKTGVDRKTIRKYGQPDGLVAGQGAFASKSPTEQEVATGTDVELANWGRTKVERCQLRHKLENMPVFRL